MRIEDIRLAVLRLIAERERRFGYGAASLNMEDARELGVSDYKLFGVLLADLAKKQLIHVSTEKFRGKLRWPSRLMVDGMILLERSERQRSESHTAFVAMWFDPTLQDAWSIGIEPALQDCGFQAIRVDQVQHNDKICDTILALIRQSALVVADFTGSRGGVYFEAGFASGLAIPVVWTCHADWIDRLHFDTRQYNHIMWNNPASLRAELTARVLATVGRPSMV